MIPYTVMRYQGQVYYLSPKSDFWLPLVYHCIDCSDDNAMPADFPHVEPLEILAKGISPFTFRGKVSSPSD